MTEPEPHWGRRTIVPLPFGPINAGGQQVSGRACLLAGWSVIETTGAAVAECDLFGGGSTGGTPLAFVALSAGQSNRESMPYPGIACEAGLFVNVPVGTVKGVLWVVER